jgi:hypothetical protein
VQFKPAIANLLWGSASLGAWRGYRAALGDPFRAQQRLLIHYLRDNADTVVGRTYRFSSIRSVEEYQARVPITTFDAIQPLVHRVRRGEDNVLTRARVNRLVPSSGSTSAVKLVPYTRTLQQEISRAIDAWIADLYLRYPSLVGGPAYWSITPAAGTARPFVEDGDSVTEGHASGDDAVPVGFEDDSRYLGGVRGALARAVLAVPPSVRLNHDLSAFQRATLGHLLLARELRLMSVWHPSFLSALLGALTRQWGALIDDVARADTARASELRRVASDDIAAIWPKLRLISCWGDGPARSYAFELATRVPGIALEPKGLLATEGIVTIPFGGRHPIAVRSHFFEFLTPTGRPMLTHQLERGVEYSVVLTTGGGLYRYHLADRVTVDGFVDRTPSLAFVGKDDRISDMFGEKLSDGFVATVLDKLFAPALRRPRFAMLAPNETPSGVCYTLFIGGDAGPLTGLESALEAELRRNPHYAWCVDAGQLGPARVVVVGHGADRSYVEFCVSQGQRLGDIKPVSLHAGTGWAKVLA